MSFNAESLPVELDGVSFLVDTRKYARTTVPALREQRDTSKEPGENALDTSGAWTRSQTDWSYGAGQTHFDLDDSDRRRFSTSSGIDPWTKGQITLLPITEQKVTVTDTDLKLESIVDIVSGNTFAYYSDGQNLKYTTSVTGSTWSASTADMGYDIKDFASDGQYVYAAFGSTNALRRVQVNSTSYDTGWGGSAENADIVAIVSGRFIGALGGRIFEMAATGAAAASSLDYTATLGGTEWVDIAGGPAGIYAAANANGTGSLYHIGVNSSDGTLSTPTVAGEMPRGETINSILIYNGVLLAATSEGLRTCLVDTSSNAVTVGPVIDDGGAAHSLEVDNRFVWWGGATGQVYRADLTRFTATLVPAWAPDLVSTSGAAGNVTSIARIAGKTYYGHSASGIWGESGGGTKVASGTLTIGEVSWSTVAPKLLRSVTVRQDRDQYTFGDTDYNAAGTVYPAETLEYRGNPTSTLLGSITFAATNDNNASSSLSLTPNVAKNFTFVSESSVSYKFVLTIGRDSSDDTKAPIVEDWLTTCIATPSRVDEIIAPIVLRRQVLTSRNSGAPATYDSNEVFTTLRQRMEAGVTVTYKEGNRTENVTIERLSMQPERLSDDGSWWEGTLVVRLLTVPT